MDVSDAATAFAGMKKGLIWCIFAATDAACVRLVIMHARKWLGRQSQHAASSIVVVYVANFVCIDGSGHVKRA